MYRVLDCRVIAGQKDESAINVVRHLCCLLSFRFVIVFRCFFYEVFDFLQ
jgi:hypothetical protein